MRKTDGCVWAEMVLGGLSEQSRAGRRVVLQFCAIRMGTTSKRETDGLVKTDNKSKDPS